jgi:hypothetical protein
MGIITKADFLRLSTDFLLSLTPQIFHGKWENEIGSYAPLMTRGLGSTIVLGISRCTRGRIPPSPPDSPNSIQRRDLYAKDCPNR